MMWRDRARPDRAALFALALLVSSCAVEAQGPAAYSTESCRRVSIVDQSTGDKVIGAEDLALDVARARLIVAAYDRRAAEKAARRNAMTVPEGGLYAVSLGALLGEPAESAMAAPIVRAEDVAGGLRPHGVSFDRQTGEVAFINRAYQKINGGWIMTPRIERVGANGEALAAATPAPCAANSLVADRGGAVVSFDHAACGWRAGIEDALSAKKSGIADERGEVLFAAASYANGLARTDTGDLVLAATRENALLLMENTPEGLAPAARIELPGGPDNLSIAPDGGVVAALHPSMFRVFLNRRLGIGAAPSRIVKAHAERGDVELLFDDPAGRLFSAASAALEWDGHLIAGSATDEGLLVCARG